MNRFCPKTPSNPRTEELLSSLSAELQKASLCLASATQVLDLLIEQMTQCEPDYFIQDICIREKPDYDPHDDLGPVPILTQLIHILFKSQQKQKQSNTSNSLKSANETNSSQEVNSCKREEDFCHFARHLLDKGYHPDIFGEGHNPLGLAARRGYVKLAELLLDYHANPYLIHFYEQSALIDAVECGETTIFDLFMSRGFTNVYGLSRWHHNLFHELAQSNSFSMSIGQKLLDLKLNIDARDEGGRTPLHYAAAEQKAEAIHFFLKHSNQSLHMRDAQGYTPLHLAVLLSKTNSKFLGQLPPFIELLVQHGAPLDTVNFSGDTLLETARLGGDDATPTLIKELMQAKTDQEALQSLFEKDPISPAPSSRKLL